MLEEVEDRVAPEEAGRRFDRVVARITGVSRARARALVDSQQAKLDGRPAPAATRVAAGSLIAVANAVDAEELVNGEASFTIAYEDQSFIVVNKPAGVVVHPGAGHLSDTLVNGLATVYPELRRLGPERNWGLVHRLDRDTSGLLIVALVPEAHELLQTQLRDREITRRYLALSADRDFDNATGTIDAPIGRDPHRPTQMAVVLGGRPARTHYLRLASWPRLTLLEVTLETGRTHQIRVHFAAIGAPLVGDLVYGRSRSSPVEIERVWLHATALSFTHPHDGNSIAVRAALPDELAVTLEALGEPVRGEIPETSHVIRRTQDERRKT